MDEYEVEDGDNDSQMKCAHQIRTISRLCHLTRRVEGILRRFELEPADLRVQLTIATLQILHPSLEGDSHGQTRPLLGAFMNPKVVDF